MLYTGSGNCVEPKNYTTYLVSPGRWISQSRNLGMANPSRDANNKEMENVSIILGASKGVVKRS